MKLIALRPVLYLSHQYDTGDELPVTNQKMVNAWLEAKSAKAVEDDYAEKKSPKAKPVTAEAGVVGKSNDGNDSELIGKIPKARRKVK